MKGVSTRWLIIQHDREPVTHVHVCHVAGQAVSLRAACVPLELTHGCRRRFAAASRWQRGVQAASKIKPAADARTENGAMVSEATKMALLEGL